MDFVKFAVRSGAGLAMSMGSVFAQETSTGLGRDEKKFTPTAEANWQVRYDAIQTELSNLGEHQWAGTYYYGDGLGVNARLTLAPQSGFVFIWTGCLGVYDRNFGDIVEVDHGHLKLNPTFENLQQGFQGFAEELVPVTWGQRQYLIPVNNVVGFCDAVNSESEPRRDAYGSYFLRRGDEKKPIQGVPAIPKEYQAYLLKEPIIAEIIAVKEAIMDEGIDGWIFHKTEVTLNVGRSKGVLPGMLFRLYEPRNFRTTCQANVLSVDEHTSTVLINQGSNARENPNPPTEGWKLTTGLPDCKSRRDAG